MDHFLMSLLSTWGLFDSLSVEALLVFYSDLVLYLEFSFANLFGVWNSSWLMVAGCANSIVARTIICELRSVDLVLCCGFLMRTSRTRWFVYSQHDDVPTCLVVRCDCVVLEFGCLTFDGPAVRLCLSEFFWVEYSSVQWASFSNGSRLFPIKQASSSSAFLVLTPPSSQTSVRTKQPVRTASLQNFSAPSPSHP